MYRKFRLDNGLRVVTNCMPRMRSVSLGIWIKVGGRYESTAIKGAAHFIEHLLFKGSRKFSCKKIKESIEGVGGALNGFTSEELTCFLVKIPAEHTFLALDVLSDMVMNPLFLESDIKKERTVILEEIKMYKDLPQSYVHELLDELLWPGQPLGETILGTNGSIEGMKPADIVSFKKSHYTASNIVISAAGLLDQGKFAQKIRKIFSGLDTGQENSFIEARESQAKPQLKVFNKNTEQTHLAMGFHSFNRGHPLRHALGLLNIILGANMSSRLFNEVREKRGLAYEIGSQLKRFHDTGAFVVHAGIDNKKVIDALELILNELSRIKNRQVTEDEFRRAKDFYLGQLKLSLEDTLDNMFWIGESTTALDKTFTLDDIIKEVSRIKKKDLLAVAEQIFSGNKLNVALIGPLQDREQEIYSKLKLS